ncbi:MAG: hypothetical protein L3K08_05425 [Thermoplasmata archaeon]|nr:hypothetical protein [Thermoplasmata archaeon]
MLQIRPFFALAVILCSALVQPSTGPQVSEQSRPGIASPARILPGAGSGLTSTTTAVHWAVNSTPVAGVSLSFGIVALLSLPSGLVEAGHTYPSAVSLQTTGDAELTISGRGLNQSYAIPALGSSNAFPIPGANVTYFGVTLQVYASVNASIVGQCDSVPTNLGCPSNLSWVASGSRNFTLGIPLNASGSSTVEVRASNLSLALQIDLTARGIVPLLGNITHPLSSVPLPGIPGTPSNVSTELAVDAPPDVLSVTASPNPVAVGRPTNVTVSTQGGEDPLSFDYRLLPSGCSASNGPSTTCTIAVAGNYSLQVTITDAQGSTSEGSLVLQVQTPPPAPSTVTPAQRDASGGVPSATWLVVAAAGGAVASGLGVYLWTRRNAGR